MNYLALGDSISIDDYTGVAGGVAVRQFARLIGAQEVEDWTRDSCLTEGVLQALDSVTLVPDIITLTAGGNDFLQGAFQLFDLPRAVPVTDWEQVSRVPLDNLERIAARLATYRCPVILNTVYDPSDGDDSLFADFGIRPEARPAYNHINDGIRAIAAKYGFLLSDLESLFYGHGITATDTWITLQIEPNLAGATAIAHHWQQLFEAR